MKITFEDDGKGKFQSCTANATTETLTLVPGMAYGSFDVSAYGATREEATNNLKEAISGLADTLSSNLRLMF